MALTTPEAALQSLLQQDHALLSDVQYLDRCIAVLRTQARASRLKSTLAEGLLATCVQLRQQALVHSTQAGPTALTTVPTTEAAPPISPAPTMAAQDARPHDMTVASTFPPSPPNDLLCPISLQLFSDPVVVASGHTYERVCIQRWFDADNDTCPLTRVRLAHLTLVPNIWMRKGVMDWCREHDLPPPPPPVMPPALPPLTLWQRAGHLIGDIMHASAYWISTYTGLVSAAFCALCISQVLTVIQLPGGTWLVPKYSSWDMYVTHYKKISEAAVVGWVIGQLLTWLCWQLSLVLS